MKELAGWSFGPFILGCGTFGGIGGSTQLIGKGLDEGAARQTLEEAVELGITWFNTADRYAGGASEAMIGRWLADGGPGLLDKVRLATKIAPPQTSGLHLRFDGAFLEERTAGSLERLGVEAVELLSTHAPDESTPIEVTLEGLEAIRESGRCRYLGASNLNAVQLSSALDAATPLGIVGYQVVQNSYNLLDPAGDQAVRTMCAESGVAYTPFSPLAGGALTGKYRRNVPPPPNTRLALRPDGIDKMLTPAVHDAIDRLRATAIERYSVDCGALALAWLLHHPEVAAPVIGPARQSRHVALAAQALHLTLSNQEFTEIESWFG